MKNQYQDFYFRIALSVTRWLDYLFNIWPFRTMKICPNNNNICQSRLTILPRSKYLLQKWPNTFLNFA